MRRAIELLVVASLLCAAGCGGDKKPPRTSGEITWGEAKQLLEQCRVVSVGQTHAKLVTLRLRSGETAFAHEPQIDDMFHVLQRIPPSCAPKSVATE